MTPLVPTLIDGVGQTLLLKGVVEWSNMGGESDISNTDLTIPEINHSVGIFYSQKTSLDSMNEHQRNLLCHQFCDYANNHPETTDQHEMASDKIVSDNTP
jgi:hypothetical protein